MKRKSIVLLVVLMVSLISFSAVGASVSQYLRSQLTVLSAKLYQEVSAVCEPGTDYYYHVALLPIMDVNGEKPLLARYLHKRMEEVISKFPSIHVAPSAEVEKIWMELKKENMPDHELFREMGHRLKVSGLILTSLVTHPTHYTINGLIINTETFLQQKVELTVLERSILDSLTTQEMELVVKPVETQAPVANAEPAQPTQPTESAPSTTPDNSTAKVPTPAPEPTKPVESVDTKPAVTPEPVKSAPAPASEPGNSDGSAKEPKDNKGNEIIDAVTEVIANAPKPAGESTPPTTSTGNTKPSAPAPAAPGQTQTSGQISAKPKSPEVTTPGIPSASKPEIGTAPEEQKKISLKKYNFVLKEESPLMNNLLLGFDIGDLDGDGQPELIYCGGMDIQARSLKNYEKIWEFQPYRPSSRDYKLITVDLDGDKKDEVASHGSLLKVVDNKLTSQQPRFLSRPASLYGTTGVALFNENAVFIVNYQGLVKKQYSIGGVGKRFLFTDLESDGTEELVVVYDGEDEQAKVKVFSIIEGTAKEIMTLEGSYGFSLEAIDLNKNGRPEIYLRKNFFNGVVFQHSKIYAFEFIDGKLQQIGESPKLNYFIVDFGVYPKSNPNRLVVGTMNLKSKQQSVQEIQSKVFFYTIE